MGLHTPALWIQAGSYSANEDRQLISAVFSRPGAVGSTDFRVTQTGTASMAVVISSGRAVINGTTTSTQASYVAYSDGNENRTITAANATNPRIDIVVLTVRDAAISGVNNDVILQVIAGTPSGSPVQPSTPADSLLLARVAVGAGVTSVSNANITNLATRATIAGALAYVASQTERDAITTFDGLRVYRQDTHAIEEYVNGTWWREGPRIPGGLTHQPRRLLGRQTVFNISDSTIQAVGGWTTRVGDDGDALGLALSNNTIAVTYSGLYHVNYSLQYPANATGFRQIQVWANATFSGTTITGGTRVANATLPGSAAGVTSVSISEDYFFAAGDTITTGSFQTSGSTLSSGSTTEGSVYWTITRLDD